MTCDNLSMEFLRSQRQLHVFPVQILIQPDPSLLSPVTNEGREAGDQSSSQCLGQLHRVCPSCLGTKKVQWASRGHKPGSIWKRTVYFNIKTHNHCSRRSIWIYLIQKITTHHLRNSERKSLISVVRSIFIGPVSSIRYLIFHFSTILLLQ